MNRTDLLLNDEVPVIILENFYNEREVELIWEELEFFTYKEKLELPSITGSATEHGRILKTNRALFLDHVWNNQRHLSNILNVNRKIFLDDMKTLKESPSWYFQLFSCEKDTTLLSYYENGDRYEPHCDSASITILHWFYKEPKRFEGGDLKLHYKDIVHEVKVSNNKSIIFPSRLKHEVTPVFMEEKYQNQKLGRYCITQFLEVR